MHAWHENAAGQRPGLWASRVSVGVMVRARFSVA